MDSPLLAAPHGFVPGVGADFVVIALPSLRFAFGPAEARFVRSRRGE